MQKKETPKGNFVWIDLEMTGLNADVDHILEIATIITDDQLNELAIGPSFIIHQPETVLASMSNFVADLHRKSGLTKAVQASTVSLEEAEEQTLAFIKQYCTPGTALLAGSSIWQDRTFLRKYMPGIIDYLYYKQIDVSSVKELVNRWYPNNPDSVLIKKEAHRALEDIQESINALRHLRKYFFIK